MPGPVFLDGDRIELRTAERDDVPFLQRWVNHPEIRRHIGMFRTPYTEEDYEDEIYEPYELGDGGATLLVCPTPGADGKTDGDEDKPTPIGSAQLSPINDQHDRANLAYWIVPPYRGEGYATEAAELLVEYGFVELGLHRISAMATAPNEGSRRVLEKLGFTHEGTKREAEFANGEYVGQAFYGLLRREWAAGNGTD